jgi:transcriptional regulator with XRE-family HTH domain
MISLHDRLRELRKGLRLTQVQLAERSGLARIEIVNLESGRNQATSIRVLRGLAQGFGLPVQDMVDFIDGVLTPASALAKVKGISDPIARRAAAATLAREDGIDEAVIKAVLAEPLDDRAATRSTLWWAIRMKRRELDLPGSDPETRH